MPFPLSPLACSGLILSFAGGYSGSSGGFRDTRASAQDFEEYDAGEWEDSDRRRGAGSSSSGSRANGRASAAGPSRSASKPTPPPPKTEPPKQEVNLFDFDDDEQAQPSPTPPPKFEATMPNVQASAGDGKCCGTRTVERDGLPLTHTCLQTTLTIFNRHRDRRLPCRHLRRNRPHELIRTCSTCSTLSRLSLQHLDQVGSASRLVSPAHLLLHRRRPPRRTRTLLRCKRNLPSTALSCRLRGRLHQSARRLLP